MASNSAWFRFCVSAAQDNDCHHILHFLFPVLLPMMRHRPLCQNLSGPSWELEMFPIKAPLGEHVCLTVRVEQAECAASAGKHEQHHSASNGNHNPRSRNLLDLMLHFSQRCQQQAEKNVYVCSHSGPSFSKAKKDRIQNIQKYKFYTNPGVKPQCRLTL